MIYVLDACALLTHLKKEPEYQKVDDLIQGATLGEYDLQMHIINLIEVYYGLIGDMGIEKADEIMKPVSSYSISFIDGIERYYREAARLKGTYSISLADSITAATAKSLSATVVTKDGEFEALEKNENLSIIWIKEPPQKP